MSDNLNKEGTIENYFENQFEYVYKWLSFAEAKNAALVAFNVAVLKVVNDIKDISMGLKIFILVLLIVSLIIALKSFFPDLSNKVEDNKSVFDENKNLIFFQDIAQIPNEHILLKLVKEKYFPEKDDSYIENKYLLDLSSEILINSRITLNKYKSFRTALCIDMIAMIFIMFVYIFG